MNPTDWLNLIWSSDLPPNTKYIACFLRKFLHGNKLTCYPSKARMIDETGMTRRTIHIHIKNLEKFGWIKIKQSNGGHNNRYTIQHGTNQTGAKKPINEYKKAPVNTGDIAPRRINKETKKNYIKKKSSFDNLIDKEWANGLVN